MGLALLIFLTQLPEPQTISADPDAPVADVGWRSSLRAKVGATPEFLDVGDVVRFRLRLPSFIELYNLPNSSDFVPSQYWRARVQIEGLFQVRFDPEWQGRFALRAEHESDHPTQYDRDVGFLNMNSLAALAGFTWARPRNRLNVDVALRLHLLTCTRDPEYCYQGGGTYGDRGFEISLGVSDTHLVLRRDTLALDVFAAAFASYTAPTNLILEERRLTMRGGLGLTRPLGRLSVYVEGWFGTQGGYSRFRGDVAQFGFGLGWAGAPTESY